MRKNTPKPQLITPAGHGEKKIKIWGRKEIKTELEFVSKINICCKPT